VSGARSRRRRGNGAETSLALVSVYRLPRLAPQFLYQLLQERKPYVNISHCVMPNWQQHCKFIARRPYSAWYLVKSGTEYVGAVYLTAANEIGVSILARWHGLGLGPRAVRTLMRKHGRRRYLANINPRNKRSIRMFRQMGFKIIQETYELQP
jgi:RimJ/RimL family protein N-acetyltransferase